MYSMAAWMICTILSFKYNRLIQPTLSFRVIGKRMKNMTITIFGLGYIGLQTAVLFANKGLKVMGVDINKKP